MHGQLSDECSFTFFNHKQAFLFLWWIQSLALLLHHNVLLIIIPSKEEQRDIWSHLWMQKNRWKPELVCPCQIFCMNKDSKVDSFHVKLFFLPAPQNITVITGLISTFIRYLLSISRKIMNHSGTAGWPKQNSLQKLDKNCGYKWGQKRLKCR